MPAQQETPVPMSTEELGAQSQEVKEPRISSPEGKTVEDLKEALECLRRDVALRRRLVRDLGDPPQGSEAANMPKEELDRLVARYQKELDALKDDQRTYREALRKQLGVGGRILMFARDVLDLLRG